MKRIVIYLSIAFFISNIKAQIITKVAGNGSTISSGDGGLAFSAGFRPGSLCFNSAGELIFLDGGDIRARKIGLNGIIYAFAGTGAQGVSGDGDSAINAGFLKPQSLTIDSKNNVYVSDGNCHCIRMIDSNNIIHTFAGKPTIAGFAGDGGLAINALLNNPNALATDKAGNLYIGDGGRIRKIDTTGIITTIAGTNGCTIFSGDGGPAITACFGVITDLSIDKLGNLFICDAGNYRIRKINTLGIVNTVAGKGSSIFSGDGGLATNAGFDCNYITVDSIGNLFITDNLNHRIRKVDTTGIITTYAGNGSKIYSGDGGLALNAGLVGTYSLKFDKKGDLYIGDYTRIRKISSVPLPTTLINFNAISTETNQVKTTWQTATEVNTSHFIVEQSSDGKIFSAKGTVKAIGSGANSYAFDVPLSFGEGLGVRFFRLKMVDKDGSFTYSKIVSVYLTTNHSPLITISPNPANNQITIKASSLKSVTIINTEGKVVYSEKVNNNTATINISTLPKGVYLVKGIQENNTVVSEKLIKE